MSWGFPDNFTLVWLAKLGSVPISCLEAGWGLDKMYWCQNWTQAGAVLAEDWFRAFSCWFSFFSFGSTVLHVSFESHIFISVAFSATLKAQPSNMLRVLVPQGSHRITAASWTLIALSLFFSWFVPEHHARWSQWGHCWHRPRLWPACGPLEQVPCRFSLLQPLILWYFEGENASFISPKVLGTT